MNTKKYDLVVYIGRFQPFHKGHQETLRRAAHLANNVLVLIGSANGPRTIKNPWTYEERKEMVEDAGFEVVRLHTAGINDYSYNDNKWIQQVGEKVSKVEQKVWASKSFADSGREKPNIAVIGHDKDHSSYYLNYFPQWDYIEMNPYPNDKETIDSTKIRQLMFTGHSSFAKGVVPNDTFGKEDIISSFMRTKEFAELQKEWDFVQEYKDKWSVAPYAPTFVTVDAVVEQSGHILLVQRGAFPGRGLWAMPGGFINEYERLKDAVVRELREETKLKVPEKVLRGSITHQDVFDDPKRSTRGRTITHAFLFQLDNASELPRVKGNDDAMDAKWVSLAEFENMQSVMYEDHYSIVKNMLGRA